MSVERLESLLARVQRNRAMPRSAPMEATVEVSPAPISDMRASRPASVETRIPSEPRIPAAGARPPSGEIRMPSTRPASTEPRLPSGEMRLDGDPTSPSGERRMPSGEFRVPKVSTPLELAVEKNVDPKKEELLELEPELTAAPRREPLALEPEAMRSSQELIVVDDEAPVEGDDDLLFDEPVEADQMPAAARASSVAPANLESVRAPMPVEPPMPATIPPAAVTAQVQAAPEPSSPQPIRAASVAPDAGPVVQTRGAIEAPRPETFGGLLRRTLALRPR